MLPFTPLLKTWNFQYFLWICENPIHSPHLFSFIDCINSTINRNKIWILTASKIYSKSTNTPKLHIFSYFLKFHKNPAWGPPSKKFDMELPYILLLIGFESGEAFATRSGSSLLAVFLVKIAQNCHWLTPLLK